MSFNFLSTVLNYCKFLYYKSAFVDIFDGLKSRIFYLLKMDWVMMLFWYNKPIEMLLIEEVDSKDFLTRLFQAIYDDIPLPNKKLKR